MKRALTLVLAADLLLCPPLVNAQQPSVPVTLTRLDVDITLDYPDGSLSGTALMQVRNPGASTVQRIPLEVNRLMEVSAVTDPGGGPWSFSQDVVRFSDWPQRQMNQVWIDLPSPLAPGAATGFSVKWSGYVTGATETGMRYVRETVDSAFTMLREETGAFPVLAVPSASANRAASRGDFDFSARITVPRDEVVAMGGTLVGRTEANGQATYEYRSTLPVPFLNIAIAPYRTIDHGGVRVFYFPADSGGAARLLNAANRALAQLTAWFGPNAATIAMPIIEIPDGYGSQASLAAGIIQSAAAFRSQQQVTELYHELSHLWNVRDEPASPRWNEGLATFMADLLREKLDGWPDRHTSIQQYATSLLSRFERDTTNLRTPFAEYGRAGKTNLSYGVGYLMFYVLYESMGETAFNQAIGGYYQKYHRTGGTTRDFVSYVQRTNPGGIGRLFEDWLYTTNWYARLKGGETLPQIAASYAH